VIQNAQRSADSEKKLKKQQIKTHQKKTENKTQIRKTKKKQNKHNWKTNTQHKK